MERIDVVAAQSRMIPAQADQILREAQMIHHGRIGSSVQSGPPEKIGRRRIPAPLLVFQELLTHEELRNSGSGEQNPHGEPASGCAHTSERRSAESAREGMRWSVPTFTMS